MSTPVEVNGHRTLNECERWLGRIENDAALAIRTQLYDAMLPAFRELTQSDRFISDLPYDLFREGRLISAADIRREIERHRGGMDGKFFVLSDCRL